MSTQNSIFAFQIKDYLQCKESISQQLWNTSPYFI